MIKVLFSYLSFQGLLISLKVEKFDCSSLEILTWHHLGVFWLQRMCYLLKSGHWGKIWLLTFWTVLNDGTEVFQTVMIQHCLKIQWVKWQPIEPCIFGILWVFILNAVHKFAFYKMFKIDFSFLELMTAWINTQTWVIIKWMTVFFLMSPLFSKSSGARFILICHFILVNLHNPWSMGCSQ